MRWPASRDARWATFFFFALALVAIESARLAVAGFWLHLAEIEAQHWKDASAADRPARAERFERDLQRSLGAAPANPWALEKSAAFHLALVRTSPDPASALASAREAYDELRRALHARPASGYLWASLALSKVYLEQLDGEFVGALRHADALARWEPAVQQVLLYTGLAAWGALQAPERALLSESLRRGAGRDGAKMYAIVKHFRRFDLVCGLSDYNSLSSADCKRSAAGGRAGRRTKR